MCDNCNYSFCWNCLQRWDASRSEEHYSCQLPEAFSLALSEDDLLKDRQFLNQLREAALQQREKEQILRQRMEGIRQQREEDKRRRHEERRLRTPEHRQQRIPSFVNRQQPPQPPLIVEKNQHQGNLTMEDGRNLHEEEITCNRNKKSSLPRRTSCFKPVEYENENQPYSSFPSS